MKRLITLVVIAVIAAGCFVGFTRLRDFGSSAAEKLTPALEKVEELPAVLEKAEGLLSSGLEKARELLPEGDGASGQSASTEGTSPWTLSSLGGAALGKGEFSSVEDVALAPTDDYAQSYVFTYGGEEHVAYFDAYSWRVYDSYKITNHDDIVFICQALLNEHPVYGSDWVSLRTAEDMAYEWEQHNLAYEVLPEDSHWRDDAKDVDLDPDDQGKSVDELYESRTGQKLDLSSYL